MSKSISYRFLVQSEVEEEGGLSINPAGSLYSKVGKMRAKFLIRGLLNPKGISHRGRKPTHYFVLLPSLVGFWWRYSRGGVGVMPSGLNWLAFYVRKRFPWRTSARKVIMVSYRILTVLSGQLERAEVKESRRISVAS